MDRSLRLSHSAVLLTSHVSSFFFFETYICLTFSCTQCDPGAARYNHTVLSVGYSTSAKEHLWAKCLSKGYVSGDNDREDCCSFTELPRCILPRQGSNQQPVGHRQNQDDSNPYCSSVQEDTVTDAQRHTWEIVENPVLQNLPSKSVVNVTQTLHPSLFFFSDPVYEWESSPTRWRIHSFIHSFWLYQPNMTKHDI